MAANSPDDKTTTDPTQPEGTPAPSPGGTPPSYDERVLPEPAKAELARLRNANSQLRNEQQKRREQMQKYEGIDPDKYAKYIEAEAKAEEERLRAEGEFEKMLSAERAKTLEATKKADSIQERWNATEIRRELLAEAAGLSATKESMVPIDDGGPSQIEAVYASQFEVVEGRILHRTARDEAGQRLSVRAYLERQKKGGGANLFVSSLKSGSGSAGGGSSGTDTVAISRRDPLKPTKVQDAIKAGKTIVWSD